MNDAPDVRTEAGPGRRGRIARIRRAEDEPEPTSLDPETPAAAPEGPSAVEPDDGGWAAAQDWDSAREVEQARVARRRARSPEVSFTSHDVGLALSGGGIRSATFSVGVLRSLSRLRLMNRIDYLSTVSGGGYAGAFYCSLFVPPQLRGQRPALDLCTEACGLEHRETLGPDPLGSAIGGEAISQLRQGGNYLMPAGTTDTLYAAVIAARNWLAVFLVTGVALLACFLAINLVRIVPMAAIRDPRILAEFPARCALEPAVILPGPVGDGCELDSLIASGILGHSYLWLLVLLLGPLWLVPCAWAFWMTRGVPRPKRIRDHLDNILPAAVAVATAIVFAALLRIDPKLARSWFAFPAGIATIASALLGIACHVGARLRVSSDDRRIAPVARARNTPATLFARENRIRAKLGRWLFRGFVIAAVLAALALVDDLGRLFYTLIFHGEGAAHNIAAPAVPPSLLVAVAAIRWLLTQGQASRILNRPWAGPVLRRLGRVLAVLFALAVLVLLLSFWSAIAYEIVWHDTQVSPTARFERWGEIKGVPGWIPPVAISAFTALAAIALGHVRSFLNQSSLAAFYAGRLRRAYLGATNPGRRTTGGSGADVNPDAEHPNDDIDLSAYYHPAVLAPLHIVNVTINETTAQSSKVIQRDRKGKSMTVSPAGYGTTPGSATDAVRVFPLSLASAEQLPLSAWIGISGAAFSTGVGQNTSLGQSLLAAMVNMRLGYWWNAPTAPRLGWFRSLGADLVQTYLLREARAEYEGTHTNRWYLSDGGHYENTGIYELVRRRVGFIIACDNGADPRYEFSDLINLVRKLRIDFEVETEFVGADELDSLFDGDARLRNAFGTLAQLVPASTGGAVQGRSAGPYATLARLRYPARDGKRPPPTTLLLIKPRISGAELPDLLRYREVNAAFPQQPTADQFFDEAQWESYFRLGELIADTLFEARPSGKSDKQRWRPTTLERLPEPSPAGPGWKSRSSPKAPATSSALQS